MKEVLLDTNFILTCVRQKIDFFEDIFLMGINIIIPEQVVKEIEKFEKKKSEAKIALVLIKDDDVEYVNLGKGKVDDLIIEYARKNPEVIIATLDKGIHRKIKNKKMIIRNRKKLEII
jgi:rRNA-processing protein FCF1